MTQRVGLWCTSSDPATKTVPNSGTVWYVFRVFSQVRCMVRCVMTLISPFLFLYHIAAGRDVHIHDPTGGARECRRKGFCDTRQWLGKLDTVWIDSMPFRLACVQCLMQQISHVSHQGCFVLIKLAGLQNCEIRS
jgi:hypothetical protein